MSTRVPKIHPALKHGAYSTTALLPGESRAAFEKLHRALIDELSSNGALEKETVATIARLLWRKQNLETLRIAELAQARYSSIELEKKLESGPALNPALSIVSGPPLKVRQAAETQARKELGETYELIGVGATVERLLEDLSVQERLDATIDKCLKRLLFLRGLKSLAPTQFASSTDETSSAPVQKSRLTLATATQPRD
jgi:hypothetical protein